MLPIAEIDTLTMTVLNAVDLAAEGKLTDGYTALLAGLERADELEEPWAPELVARWRQAVERYCTEYGVRE